MHLNIGAKKLPLFYQSVCLIGELTMIRPARSDLVDGGKYTIVVRATDGGIPPLHSDVKVGPDQGSGSETNDHLRPNGLYKALMALSPKCTVVGAENRVI